MPHSDISEIREIVATLTAVQQIEQKGAQRSLLLLILDDLWDSCSLKHEQKAYSAFRRATHFIFGNLDYPRRKIRSHQLQCVHKILCHVSQAMHRRLQIRKQAPQSKLRELHPKGSLCLLCATTAKSISEVKPSNKRDVHHFYSLRP